MHQASQVQKELDKISYWSFEEREKILDVLTDFISDRTLYDEDFQHQLEVKISELEEFDKAFKRLSLIIEKIDPLQFRIIFNLSLIKLKGKISSIRDEINAEMWNKDKDVSQLLVLDQIFFLIQELIKEAEKEIDNVGFYFFIIAVSLLKIEAFHRGKITFDDLQNYISDLSSTTLDKNLLPRDYDVVFEALEA